MESIHSFAEVIEAIDALSLEEQQTLIEIVVHRVIERSRQQLTTEVQQARTEFSQGQCQPASVESLMAEILS